MSDSAASRPRLGRVSIALVLFCVLLVLLPVPLGGNRLWARAAIWLPLFVLAAGVCLTARGRSQPMARWLITWPGAALLAFLAVVAVQWMPGSPIASLVPFRTTPYLLTALACCTAAWLSLTLVRDETSLRWLIGAVIVSGLLQSALAVAFLAFNVPVYIGDTELGTDGTATGTFPNRNHLAFFLNLCLACGIGLLVGGLRQGGSERTWAQVARDWLELMLSPKARLRLLLILMVIALILTRSRGGNSSFFVGLLFAMIVFAIHARERRRGMLLLAASLVVVDLLLIGTWVGVDQVMDRVQRTSLTQQGTLDDEAELRAALGPEKAATADKPAAPGKPGATGSPPSGTSTPASPATAAQAGGTPAGGDGSSPAAGTGSATGAAPPAVPQEQSVEDRTRPATEAIALVRQSPWFGSGGGSFYLAFMPFMPYDMGFYDHAHNDYLEIAADVGLVGLGALVLFALASAWRAYTLLRDRHNAAVRGAGFAALMALACIATHSVVDFSLQIPAIAVMTTVVLMLPWAAAKVPSGQRARRSRRRRSGSGSSDSAVSTDAADTAADTAAGTAAAQAMTASAAAGAAASAPAASSVRALSGWALGGVTALVLLTAAWHSWRLGVAEYLALGASLTVAGWEERGEVPTPEGIDDTLRALRTPIELAPDNAEYRESRGSLLYARASLPDRDAALVETDYRAALDSYRDAAERSPRSGYIWGNVMLLKYRLQEIDREFYDAFDRAVALAPYEPGVQTMVVGVGFSLWRTLTPDARAKVTDTVRRAWRTNRAGLLYEATDAKELPAICKDDALPLRALCKAVKDAASEAARGAAK